MCLTAVKLGNDMKADEALLLPELHQTFQLEVHNCQCYFASELQLSPVKIHGNRWLLSHSYIYTSGVHTSTLWIYSLGLQSHQSSFCCFGASTIIHVKSC